MSMFATADPPTSDNGMVVWCVFLVSAAAVLVVGMICDTIRKRGN